MNLVTRAKRVFGYDGADISGRRRRPAPVTTTNEDRIATEGKRRILSANARDLARNFAIAAWAIRKHLDYVSRFTFQSVTGDREYDRYFEDVMRDKMSRYNFDVLKRHPYRRAIRITEACRVKDGDVLWVKMAPPNGYNLGKVQAIEGDRIRTPRHGDMPSNTDPDDWVNGVRVSKAGTAQAYAITDRNKHSSGFKLNRIVPARNVVVHGFYDRFDQVRGVSPVAAALNWFRDTYEGFEYALAKVKVSQLFGLAFYRDADAPVFGSGTAKPTVDSNGDGEADSGYEVDLNKGPFTLDLDPGDRAEFLENKTPSSETVEFLKMMIHIAIKSLDIPYSFFDESFTNFYGSRGGLVQYLNSCKSKIEDLQEFQDEWARWRVGIMVAQGDLELPSGKDFNFLKWIWVPGGVPWWDPVKEVRGSAMAVAAGFTSPQRVCQEIGTDFEENIRATSEAMKLAKDLDVPLTFADSTAFRPAIESNGDPVEENQND